MALWSTFVVIWSQMDLSFTYIVFLKCFQYFFLKLSTSTKECLCYPIMSFCLLEVLNPPQMKPQDKKAFICYKKSPSSLPESTLTNINCEENRMITKAETVSVCSFPAQDIRERLSDIFGGDSSRPFSLKTLN